MLCSGNSISQFLTCIICYIPSFFELVYFYVQEVTCTDLTRCIKKPISCTSSQDCDVLISYQYNATEDALVITIATNATHKWVSFTQVPTLGSDKMVIDFCC